jgi:hypothetical protein
VPTFNFHAAFFQDLSEQIEQALHLFETARPEAFGGMDEMPMTIDAPNLYYFDLNGWSYMQEFVLPSL